MKNKRSLFPILVVIILTADPFSVQAQSQEKIYSLMLLNFAKGIHWPTSPSEYFVVGVLAYPPLIPELRSTTANSKIHGKKIKVIEIFELEDSKDCHIVFLPAYKAKLLPEVLEKIVAHPTLIVSNKTDLVRKGSGIDLVLRDGKLTFDINCKAIEGRGLKVGSGLRATGTIVN